MTQGHATHLLSSSTHLNQWWSNMTTQTQEASVPNWFLLAYFVSTADSTIANIGETTNEKDTLAAKTEKDVIYPSIDDILHPSKASQFMTKATLTYIVIGIHSYEYSTTTSASENQEIHMTGLTAAQTLLDHNYKVQLLAASHFDGEKVYRPNHLFQSQKEVHHYLTSGAQFANRHATVQPQKQENKFEALLFATQGLDLAIPSRLSYLQPKLEYLDLCNATENQIDTGRCDAKLNRTALDQNVFLSCPAHHYRAKIAFHKASTSRVKVMFDDQMLDVKANGAVKDDPRVELWLGHEDISKAEAVCMRVTLEKETRGATKLVSSINSNDDATAEFDINPQPVACTTRILKQKSLLAKKNLHAAQHQHPLPQSAEAASKLKPNISEKGGSLHKHTSASRMNFLSILIDPISRNQFQRSLPNTMALLEQMNFHYFPKYTVVGDNSGPNQAALFTGVPLVGGRQGIKSSESHTHNSTLLGDRSHIRATKKREVKTMSPQWLWDGLNEEGYVTLKAEDVCIKNSNMVQSMKPQTTHGEQLYRMFCFDFDRPNCLGKDMAATHLMNYAKQFMTAYGGAEKKDINNKQQQPWAAMLSFVDSHEDSLTLISYLDEMFVDFLQSIDLTNTVVVFSSDHGLHYGPSFLSNGERERAEPILYIHVPEESFDLEQLNALKNNQDFWVTPFDVHETILDATLKRLTNEGIGK
eukprot:9842811-Ditylum_brightwellii.AAC.1